MLGAEEEGSAPDGDFEDFVEAAFPDLDVEFLFDPAMDGIEDSPVCSRRDGHGPQAGPVV